MRRMRTNNFATMELQTPRVAAEWFREPELVFAEGHTHCDPKVGLPLYGPRSLGSARHKRDINIGFLGTAEAVERAAEFYAECAEGVPGDAKHLPFPGCK